MNRLISAVRRRLSAPRRSGIDLPRHVVESVVRESGADEWHIWGICQHQEHREAVAATQWILRHIARDQRIFETGCGCGANLLWLAQRGFKSLSGADLSPSAVLAANGLAIRAKANINVWRDDSLAPSRLVEWNVLLAIDWTYLRNVDFDLRAFLSVYKNEMLPGAFVLFDMVDSSFDQTPNNQFSTDDWLLPPAERRPTQYKLRMSREQIQTVAAENAFDVVDVLPGTQIPPRFLYVLKSRRA